MKKKYLLLLILYLMLCISGCKSDLNLPEDLPEVKFDGSVQIFLPDFFNPETGCYVVDNGKLDSDVVANLIRVNNFTESEATIGFIIVLERKVNFVSSGVHGLYLYQYDEGSETWKRITEPITYSPNLWQQGEVIHMLTKTDKTNEICDYLPLQPIYIQSQLSAGRYRLFILGRRYDINNFAYTYGIGDFVEFSIISIP